MGNSFPGSGFGGGFGSNFGNAFGGGGTNGAGFNPDAIWQAMEQVKARFEKKTGSRVGRGDVRAAVLAILAEKPMHGYQIMAEIEERSGGAWKPSPGSVYPTLQLLADEGLIRAEESSGRKTYSLTEEGRLVADAATDAKAPWEDTRGSSRTGALPKAGFDLAQAVAQVGRTAKPAQVDQAVAVLEEARRKLYSILAQD